MDKLGTLRPWECYLSILSPSRPMFCGEIRPTASLSVCSHRELYVNLSTRQFHGFLPRVVGPNWSRFATQCRRAKMHLACSPEIDKSFLSMKMPVRQSHKIHDLTEAFQSGCVEESFYTIRPTDRPCTLFGEQLHEKASPPAHQVSADEGNASRTGRLYSLAGLEASTIDAAELRQSAVADKRKRDANKTLQHVIRHVGFAIAAAMIGLFGHANTRAPLSVPAHAATTEILLERTPGQVGSQKPTFKQRAVYALDYFFATEPAGKAVILLAITAMMTAVGGGLYYRVAVAEDPNFEFPESVWTAWTFVADPGTHATENTFRKRLVAVPLTMGGMLFFALLVGLMSDAVSSKVDQLQKGASPVIEENHTLIVGWTSKTIPLVKELTEANKSRGLKRSIVVLGNLEKEAMDEELLQTLPLVERHGSKVVTRKGRPTATEDLKLCSAALARSIIVLSPNGVLPNEADAQVLQTCLVLAYLSDIQGDVVAELAQLDSVKQTKDMLSTAINFITDREGFWKPKVSAPAVASPAVGDKTEKFRKVVPVATDDIVLRMMVERALQPGTAAVAKELLLFEGSEFRFKAWPQLVGKKFEEVLYLFEDAIPCGLRKNLASGKPSDRTLVNPPPDTIIEEGDKILVISEDDDSYKPNISHEPSQGSFFKAYQKQNKPVLKVLITGFRHDLKDVLRHIDSSVAKGSEVTILATEEMEIRNRELKQGSPLQNIKLTHKLGSPLSRQVLEELPLETYDKTIILGNNNGESALSATTATAMFVRHIQIQRGRNDNVIVAELAAAQDDALQRVQETWMIDSVIPEELQAMVLAHLAEDADVGAVLDEVVSDSGSNMLLQEVGTYADYGDILSFWDLQARALQNGEIVIAHKCAANGGVWVLNPSNKSDKLVWNQGDEVLVLTRPS